MQSHFDGQVLAEIFRDLYVSERRGILKLTRDNIEKRIYFDRGLIRFSESELPHENLGSCLVQEGKISAGALVEAQENSDDPSNLAEVLVHRDLVARETVTRTAREIVDRVIRSVFQWEGGMAAFGESPELPGFFEGDVLGTCEVILRGISEMSTFQPIKDAMLGLDNRLRLRQPSPVPLERMTLSPAHGFTLSQVDGSTTVQQIISILPQAEGDQAVRFLFGLLVMGLLEYDPPLGEGPFKVANILRDHADRRALEQMQDKTIEQVYKQTKNQSPAECLGLQEGASRDAIERAYEEAKSAFSRERILPRVRERHRSELAVIESRLIESYLKLTQPSAIGHTTQAPQVDEEIGVDDLLVRVEMDKTRSQVAQEQSGKVADGYYSQAVRAARDGDYHNAIQYGKLAISHNDRDARYYYMLADCQVRNPGSRWQRMAEHNYSVATQLDPWNPEYLVSLGRFYRRRGLNLRARKVLEEALRLAPGHEEAGRELAELD